MDRGVSSKCEFNSSAQVVFTTQRERLGRFGDDGVRTVVMVVVRLNVSRDDISEAWANSCVNSICVLCSWWCQNQPSSNDLLSFPQPHQTIYSLYIYYSCSNYYNLSYTFWVPHFICSQTVDVIYISLKHAQTLGQLGTCSSRL